MSKEKGLSRRDLFRKSAVIAAAGTTKAPPKKTIVDSKGIERCRHCWVYGRMTCTCGDLFTVSRPKIVASPDFATASASAERKTIIDVNPGWFFK
jgi:hypothetical protein